VSHGSARRAGIDAFFLRARTAIQIASQGRRASCADNHSNAVCRLAAIDSVAGVLIAVAFVKIGAALRIGGRRLSLGHAVFGGPSVVISPGGAWRDGGGRQA